ncbi:hypothetical protein [Bradyrhizobium liaoningense]|uniref:hypothetical protein n=1 Tax=Bradyrhizobium liaoningense TaxID=43992 RepID=UPI001BA74ECA|nr:hypothetical protein [Bradyrhizobium liaoningense]MBR1033671.1 hypothetical protein [Bradyrhizobium liaoningense]
MKEKRSGFRRSGPRLDHAERALPHLPLTALDDGDGLSDVPLETPAPAPASGNLRLEAALRSAISSPFFCCAHFISDKDALSSGGRLIVEATSLLSGVSTGSSRLAQSQALAAHEPTRISGSTKTGRIRLDGPCKSGRKSEAAA